jgi:hypothetical protein
MRCHLGETVEVEVDGSRYFYRATVYCESGDSQLIWPVPTDDIFPSSIRDGTSIVWECSGTGPSTSTIPWQANHWYSNGAIVYPGNGYTYTATADPPSDPTGESGDSQLIWPVLIRDDPISHIKDRYPQVWEWFGTAPSSLSEQFPSIFEPILDCAQIMLVKECNQLPPPGDPLSEDDYYSCALQIHRYSK